MRQSVLILILLLTATTIQGHYAEWQPGLPDAVRDRFQDLEELERQDRAADSIFMERRRARAL